MPIQEGLRVLSEIPELIGHGSMGFDLPVIRKLYPTWSWSGKMLDTLLCSRLIWTDIGEGDYRLASSGKIPGRLIGSHSLEAWGYRLGVLKGDFGKTADWQTWSAEMQAYCEQDVSVTGALLIAIEKQNYSQEAIELEHRFAEIIYRMTRHGFAFDRKAAEALHVRLLARREELSVELQRVFPPKIVETVSPKKKIVKRKSVPFNPASRQQIAERLRALGWKPTQTTPTGLPQIDDAILETLPYPEAKPLAEFFLLNKRIGQLADGDKAWLKLEVCGRMHGEVITNQAVTGRCSHVNPNMAQVPSVGSPYGAECRSLFIASPGKVLVGADASGLELRCLSHFLARYDGGAYVLAVTQGDVHTTNQEAFGLPPGKAGRGNSKTGIYAKIYGAGPEKLGSSLGELKPEAEAAAQAEELPGWAKKSMLKKGPLTPERVRNWKRGFYAARSIERGITGFDKLIAAVAFAVKNKGHLIGLDGRRLRVRSMHAALNTLLQGAGALIVKYATVLWHEELLRRGYQDGIDFALVCHCHDEIQAECRPEIAKEVGEVFVWALGEVQKRWNFRCPLTGEYKTGSNWAETH